MPGRFDSLLRLPNIRPGRPQNEPADPHDHIYSWLFSPRPLPGTTEMTGSPAQAEAGSGRQCRDNESGELQ